MNSEVCIMYFRSIGLNERDWFWYFTDTTERNCEMGMGPERDGNEVNPISEMVVIL